MSPWLLTLKSFDYIFLRKATNLLFIETTRLSSKYALEKEISLYYAAFMIAGVSVE